MAYAQTGAGSTAMVFLHGTGCDSADWGNVIPHLPATLRYVTLDFRGHGASDLPADTFTLADLAADVVALLDALHLTRVILVGHSLGGMVAMVVATHVRFVTGLVLLEGWTNLRAAVQAFPQSRFYGQLPPQTIQRIAEMADQTMNAFPPAVWKVFWESVESFDGAPHLRAARIPVFEVYGGLGKTAATEALLQVPANPSIRLFWIDGAGHYLPQEKPLEVARLCTQMLQQCELRTS